MNDMDVRLRWILAIALTSIVLGGTLDLATDAPTSWLSFHAVFELLLVAGALLMATTLWLGWWRSVHSAIALQHLLEARTAERDQWQERVQQSLSALGTEIDAQLRRWRLTDAEREVAMLLLEGHGHKRIAALTGRSERTVRQHASAVYEKSGLAGRNELSAYFLHGVASRRSSA